MDVVDEVTIPDDCEMAEEIPAEDGTISGSTVDANDDFQDDDDNSGDVVYMFELDEVADVNFRLLIPGESYWLGADWEIEVYLADGACSISEEVAMLLPLDAMYDATVCLEPGVYYIIIDGDSIEEGSYEIDLDFESTDTCYDPEMDIS